MNVELPNPLSEVRVDTNSPLTVFIPGFSGAARNMTAFRQMLGDNGLVFPSVSTKEAHVKNQGKGRDYIERHYGEIAQEIVERARDRKHIILIGHSLGGEEQFDAIRKLLARGEMGGKKIDMAFLGTPGFGLRGVRGLAETGRRLVDLVNHISLQEQEYIYPPPEVYFERKKPTQSGENESNIADDPKQRQERREWFIGKLDDLHVQPNVRSKLLDKLEELDRSISNVSSVVDRKKELKLQVLFKKRAKLLGPYISALAEGYQFTEDEHLKYLRQYKETDDNLSSGLTCFTNMSLYLARTAKDIFRGMDQKLPEIYRLAKEKGVDLRFSFFAGDRDIILTKPDLHKLQETLLQYANNAEMPSEHTVGTKEDWEALAGIWSLENVSHTSVAYDTGIVRKIVNVLAA